MKICGYGSYKTLDRAKEVLLEIAQCGSNKKGVLRAKDYMKSDEFSLYKNELYKEDFDVVDCKFDFIPYENNETVFYMPLE